MLRDRNYRRWFLAQPNLRIDQPSLFAIIANDGIAQNRPVKEQSAPDVAGEAREELLRTFIWERSLIALLLRGVTFLQASIVLFEEIRTKTVDLSVLLFCRAILRLTSSVPSYRRRKQTPSRWWAPMGAGLSFRNSLMVSGFL